MVRDNFLELSVFDKGLGLSPEFLPKVFEKFFRAPSAPAGGSGLGLAIVKGFVEAQGGQVTAANRPEGGAVFTIRLPQTEQPPNTEPRL
jgi:signal transduction histidine kinase